MREKIFSILLIILSLFLYAEGLVSFGFCAQDLLKELTGRQRVIVEFKEEPLIKEVIKKSNSKGKYYTKNTIPLIDKKKEILNVHHKFRTDISGLRASINSNKYGVASSESKERFFSLIFNGAALIVDEKIISEIKKLDYVKEIYLDQECQILLHDSTSLVQANKAWNDNNIIGVGVKVAVLDTGIDYLHADLGGGFGPGYKVVGGYDYVNEDNDPLDDHGHGTHCAGIIAANGQIKGIAPGASLYAYKVLNHRGRGYNSDIIAALEKSLDPNGDGKTDDKVDIINLSMGTIQGNPDDVLSRTVDNIYEAGVLVVVAAGNKGNRYKTITSPGCARNALTVGASTKADRVASFSSRGPVEKTYAIKPEMLAPGRAITSTGINGQYFQNDGTSMAAPHVAGAAALLKELYPDWGNEQLKAALIESSKQIDGDIFTQGAGRLEISKAISQELIIFPSILNLGKVSYKEGLVHKIITLNVTNVKNYFVNYTLEITGTDLEDLLIEFSDKNIKLDPYESKVITVDFKVGGVQCASKVNELTFRTGVIIAQNVIDDLKVSLPFVFAENPECRLSFHKEITNSPNVRVNFLYGSLQPEYMYLYGDMQPTGWIPFSDRYLVNLHGKEGEKTIYAVVKEADGFILPTMSASVVLDTSAPAPPILQTDSPFFSSFSKKKITVNCSEAISFVKIFENDVLILTTNIGSKKIFSIEFNLSPTFGTKNIKIKVQDIASNESEFSLNSFCFSLYPETKGPIVSNHFREVITANITIPIDAVEKEVDIRVSFDYKVVNKKESSKAFLFRDPEVLSVNILKAFDISFVPTGNDVDFQGEVTINSYIEVDLQLAQQLSNTKNIRVYYLDEKEHCWNKSGISLVEIDKQKVVFNVEHLSCFSIAAVEIDEIAPNILNLQIDDKESFLDGDYIDGNPAISIVATDNKGIVSYRLVLFEKNSNFLSKCYDTDTVNISLSDQLTANISIPFNLSDGFYFFKVYVCDAAGNVSLLESTIFEVQRTESLSIKDLISAPNPFNPKQEVAHIGFQLNKQAKVYLYIHSINGRLIYEDEKNCSVGYSEFIWDGSDKWGNDVVNGGYIGYLIVKSGNKKIARKIKIAVYR